MVREVHARVTSYPDSVRFLYSLGNEVKTLKLGLERITTVLEALGHPERAFQPVHVAGTNGKGSTSAMIEAGLRSAGFRTGLYTSPHLVEPAERIRINGEPVTEEQFTHAFEQVHATAEQLIERGSIDGHPTYFETVTAMGFLLFRNLGVEKAVVEVGLGGRLDATNVLRPALCAITPVDYDHETWLGSSLDAIAAEKAGILKPGVPAIIAPQSPQARERIVAAAGDVEAPLEFASDWQMTALELHAGGSRFIAKHEQTYLAIECPLAGEHQVTNALVAAVALHRLGAPVGGIANARWPGRLERVATCPEIIVDGAHNPAGARALAAYIERFYSGRKVWLVFAAMRDKSLDEIGELLAPLVSEIILTAALSPRSLRPEALAGLFDHPRIRTTGRLADALAIIRREAAPDDAVFITGSLYLVGEAKSLL